MQQAQKSSFKLSRLYKRDLYWSWGEKHNWRQTDTSPPHHHQPAATFSQVVYTECSFYSHVPCFRSPVCLRKDESSKAWEEDGLMIVTIKTGSINKLYQSERQITPSGRFLGKACAVTCLWGQDRRGAASDIDEPSTASLWDRPWNFAKRFIMEFLSKSWHSILTSNKEALRSNLKG